MRARRGDRMRWFVTWGLLALAASGCASGEPTRARTRVPITELTSVVGRWEGLLTGLSPRPSMDEDLIDVVIRADGTYEAKAYRTIGVFQGRGTVEIRDGSLILRGQQGATGTGQLFPADATRELAHPAPAAHGRRVTARLSPRS